MYRVENIIYVQSEEYHLCTEWRISFMYRVENIIFVHNREYHLCTE